MAKYKSSVLWMINMVFSLGEVLVIVSFELIPPFVTKSDGPISAYIGVFCRYTPSPKKLRGHVGYTFITKIAYKQCVFTLPNWPNGNNFIW